jgi:hypothetical protein
VRSFFRIDSADKDPESCLVPAHQDCAPWGGGRTGSCDKCRGAGRTEHKCLSCLEAGADPGCPACHGELRYRDSCPACAGEGEIDDSRRQGVSVFPELDGLYRYMLKHDADLDGCQVVEIQGQPSGDEDFDADEGALLIRPERIVATRPLEPERVERLRREVGER